MSKANKPPCGPVLHLGRPEDREAPGKPGLKIYSGSDNLRFTNTLLNATLNTLWHHAGATDEERQVRQGAAMAAIVAFKPADEIEGMLAAQTVAMHAAAMECFRRAMLPEQSAEVAARLRKDGANLARGMTDMLDAMDRKRGKASRQVVRVERVMVQSGGQAIVGHVTAGQPGGEGANGKSADEPHAPPAALAHDATPSPIVAPVRGSHPDRLPVPVPGHAERALPHARRG